MIDYILRAPSESPWWRPPDPRDRKHSGVRSAVLGVFAAVYSERAALRTLSEHGSAEPDPGCRFRVSFWYRTVPFRARPGTGRSASILDPHRSSEVGSTGVASLSGQPPLRRSSQHTLPRSGPSTNSQMQLVSAERSDSRPAP